MSHYAIIEKNENTSRMIVIEKTADGHRSVSEVLEVDGTSKESIEKLVHCATVELGYNDLIITDKKNMYDF